MRRVSDLEIQAAWDEVNRAIAATRSGDGISELMARFEREQPDPFDFVIEACSSLEKDAADLAFHAALVIWLSFSAIRPIESDALIRNYKKTVEWLDGIQGEAVLLQKKMADFQRESQPELIRYLVELVFEAHEDGLEIEPEEQERLLIALKTLIDSFSEVS